MRRRIVLDTDMGSDVDDALCLALALAAPEIELVAVTHVCGDTGVRAQISRRLLDLAGRREVPVYAGRSTPLTGGGRFVWFGHEGVGILDGASVPIPDDDAVSALCRRVADASDIELVAIGPLTNIAAALAADPAFAGRVRRLTLMGGCVRGATYGGISFPPAYDYNLCADPDAALRVLAAGVPTRMIPIDVTMRVWIEERDARAMERSGSALQHALARAVRRWSPGMKASLAGAGADPHIDNMAFLHDPLAFACAYDESFCTFEDLWIEPRVDDGLFSSHERGAGTPGAHRIRCATAVDGARFVAHFRERLSL